MRACLAIATGTVIVSLIGSGIASAQSSGPPRPPQQTAVTDNDRIAAYCMEASFGYVSRLTRFVTILRENRGKAQALFDQPALPADDKKQIADAMKSLDGDIVASEEKIKRWNGSMKVFMDHLQRRGLLGTDLALHTAAGTELKRDQNAVSDVYRSCLRQCDPGNGACRRACDETADRSDSSKRMLACEQRAQNFN